MDILNSIKKDFLSFKEKALKSFKSINKAALLKKIIPYAIVAYIFNRLSWLYGLTKGNVIERLMSTLSNFSLAFKSYIPSMTSENTFVGLIAGMPEKVPLQYIRQINRLCVNLTR